VRIHSELTNDNWKSEDKKNLSDKGIEIARKN